MKNEFSHSELESLLPEYLFGDMDNDTKQRFEDSAKNYSDIMSEIENVKITLSKFDEYDLKGNIKQESRNLSVKVQEKLAKKKKTSHIMGTFPKYVYPSLGLLTLIYLFFFTDNFDKKEVLKVEFKIFNQSDLALIDLESSEILPELIESNLIYNDPLLNNLNFKQDEIYDLDIEEFDFNFSIINSNFDVFLNELDESEFNELMEDIENEKIGV